MSKQKAAPKPFHIDYLNHEQENARIVYDQCDVLFMLGPAGTGKTLLAMAFAIQDVLGKQKKKIILTRPTVESGESLGWLPGDFKQKVNPFMMPLYDSVDKLAGFTQKETIKRAIEISPIAYLRGRTLSNSVAILDEAQNCTYGQLKLYLTRLGDNSKMIITGDTTQTDLKKSGLPLVISKLNNINGVGFVEFTEEAVVRHRLVREFIRVL